MSQNRKNPGPLGDADSRKKEAARLHEWCRVVLDTMSELHPEMTSRASLMYGLDVALREGKVAALRIGTKDLLEWVHGLKPGDRARIDQALRSKFGTGLAEDMRAMAQEVKAILERGIINDEDEFRLLQSWVEMINTDPKKQSGTAVISKLMERFVKDRE